MAADDTTRQRLITWGDPVEIREALLSMGGLAFFHAIAEGRVSLPPMMRLMGFRIISVAEGHIVFEADPAEYHYNPVGVVHGGFAATLLDSAIGCSLLSRLPEGTSFTTLEIKVSYLRTATEQTGPVHTKTTILSLGRRVANVESHLLDASGRLYATASSTCLILPPEPAKE
jgi:uncharacterized protein (TIGR00369 family)